MSRVGKIMIYLAVVLIIIMPINASATIDSFSELSGSPQSGKVKIELGSFKNEDGRFVTHPKKLRMTVGETSSYIPVIKNIGEKCNLRIKLYAKSGDESIDIMKYCFGFEDDWILDEGWFYYKKELDKDETIKICDGFYFPDEWKWRACNVLDVTVEAEAIADEDVRGVKTGDRYQMKMLMAILLIASLTTGLLLVRGGKNYGR